MIFFVNCAASIANVVSRKYLVINGDTHFVLAEYEVGCELRDELK